MEHLALVNRETVPLGPIAHLLNQAILLRLEDVAALTYTHTQGRWPKWRSKKYAPHEKTEWERTQVLLM